MLGRSNKLVTLLAIRALARLCAPILVVWLVVEAWPLPPQPLWGVLAIVLFGNYVAVYVLTWVAPHHLDGIWRFRPIQGFVLLGACVAIPIVHVQTGRGVPWLFVGVAVLYHVGLIVAIWVHLYLHHRSPLARTRAGRPAAPAAGTTENQT